MDADTEPQRGAVAELPVLSDAETQKTGLPQLKCENTFELCKAHV